MMTMTNNKKKLNQTIIVGVDYSITSPAIFVNRANKRFQDGKVYAFGNKKMQRNVRGIKIDPYPDWNVAEERHNNICLWALDKIVSQGKPDLVVLEGYSFGSKGKVFNLAENTGLLKHNLWLQDIPVIIPPPQTVKKFATGKGNADKFQMVADFVAMTDYDIRKDLMCTGKNIKAPITDIVDAYWMWAFGVNSYTM